MPDDVTTVRRAVRALDRVRRLPTPLATLAVVVLMVGTALLDQRTGPGFSPLVGYLLAVLVAVVALRRPIAEVLAVASGVLSVVVVAHHPGALGVASGVALAVVRSVVLLTTAAALRLSILVLDVLQAQATTDPMTGLLNRRGLMARLEEEVARARRTGTPLTVVALDLDGVKQVNDVQGHAAGDAMIVDFAARLGAERRAGDVAARVGGDEFVLVLPAQGREESAAALGRLRVPGAPRFGSGTAMLDGSSSRLEVAEPRPDAIEIRGLADDPAQVTALASSLLVAADVALVADKQRRRTRRVAPAPTRDQPA